MLEMDILTVVLYLATLFSVSHASIFSSDFETKLQAFIGSSMKCRHIPGMTLAVVKGNETWTHGYGKEDISTNRSVDAYTRFNIGSITKSFTATLVGILLNEKGLNWTTKVRDILGPTYEFVDPYRKREMTLRDLMSHRTGLARLDLVGNLAGIQTSVSRAEFCRKMKYLPEELPFRDGFLYNNYMFMMAGHVAEKLGQDTWENLMVSRVLQPLGMNHTKFMTMPSVVEDHTARPYIYLKKSNKFVNGTLELYSLYPADPAGAIMSSSSDMIKWLKFHLSLGKTETDTQLLDAKHVRQIHQVTTAVHKSFVGSMSKPSHPVDDFDIGYGYGMFVSEYRGYRKIFHSGGWGSYISLMWMFPDMKFGIYASVNGPSGGFDSGYHLNTVFYYISDYLLGETPWLNMSTACTYPEPWSEPPREPVHEIGEKSIAVNDIDELTGAYTSDIFAEVNVYSNGTTIHMDINRARAVLHPSSEKDRFLYEIVSPIEYAFPNLNVTHYNMNVTFERQPSSQAVSAIILHLEVDVRYDKKTTQIVIG